MKNKRLELFDFIPRHWFKEKEKSSIWVTGIKVIGVDPIEIPKGYETINMDNVIAILTYGQLNYLDTKFEMKIMPNNTILFDGSNVKHKQTPVGAWLILLQPYIIDGHELSEDHLNYQISMKMGLLSAFNGQNMVFQRFFDYDVELKSKKLSARSPTFINPGAFPKPNVSKERLLGIERAHSNLSKIQEDDKKRIELSLHWLELAVKDDSIDGFIKYWIALEVLGMPDTTNIKPLNEVISKAYGITYDEAKKLFEIGRLFGLRSKMVHRGKRIPMNQYLAEYIEAIYIDILFEKLSMPCERRAENVRSKPEFVLSKLIN